MRAVEFAARAAIERSTDADRWRSLLNYMSRDGAHGSWRRSTLLALVRSEAAPGVPWLWDKQPLLEAKDVNGVVNKSNAAWDLTFTSIK